jgi:hypothetical protein
MQHTTAQHAAVACSLDIQRTKYPSSDSLCNSLTAGSGSDAFAQYGPPVSRHQFGIVVPPQFGGLVQSWVAPQLLVQLTFVHWVVHPLPVLQVSHVPIVAPPATELDSASVSTRRFFLLSFNFITALHVLK